MKQKNYQDELAIIKNTTKSLKVVNEDIVVMQEINLKMLKSSHSKKERDSKQLCQVTQIIVV